MPTFAASIKGPRNDYNYNYKKKASQIHSVNYKPYTYFLDLYYFTRVPVGIVFTRIVFGTKLVGTKSLRKSSVVDDFETNSIIWVIRPKKC